MARSKGPSPSNGGGSSGKKNGPVAGCRNFLIVRTPKMSKLNIHSEFWFPIWHWGQTFARSSAFPPPVVFIFSLLLPSVPSGHPCGTSDSECFNWGFQFIFVNKRNASCRSKSGSLRPQWNLREAIGLTLKSWETFDRRWFYRIFCQEWTWEAVSQIYFPSQSWLKLCTKAPQFWNCAVTLFSQQLVNILLQVFIKNE